MTAPGDTLPAGWREAALEPPLAMGTPPARGTVKATPADFIIEEQLGFEPDGGPAHLLLRVQKTAANTLEVARALARRAGTRATDVGFAGLKDRQAVATQWFSVPASRRDLGWTSLQGPGFAVLEAHPHSRKLRRGALAGNLFRIRVSQPRGVRKEVEARLATIAAAGVPSYFGPQRFGAGGSNLARVAHWLASGRLPGGRDERSFTLSAARSLAFNAVLGARVRAGTWSRLLDGDVLNLDGSNSVFLADGSEGLEARIAGGDLHPTGPMPGRGGLAPVAAAAEAENAALAPYAAVAQALAEAGVDAERRALRVLPRRLEWDWEDGHLALVFVLRRGAFATALLRELVRLPEGDETAAARGQEGPDPNPEAPGLGM